MSVKKMMDRVLKEPLVHFLIIGGLFYLYFDTTKKSQNQPKKIEIAILKYDLKQLEHQSSLDDKALLMEYLKYKKALLEDAYALELSRDDAKIQKMLLQKREFILNANAKVKEPTQEELKEYYKKHPKDFSKLLGFDLLVLKFDPKVDKQVIDKLLLFGDLKKAKDIKSYKDIDKESASKKFGRYALLKISQTPQDHWSEPIHLQDGTYLFYVTDKKTDKLKEFEDVQGDVYREYLYTKRLQKLKEAYKQMLKNYTFKVKE